MKFPLRLNDVHPADTAKARDSDLSCLFEVSFSQRVKLSLIKTLTIYMRSHRAHRLHCLQFLLLLLYLLAMSSLLLPVRQENSAAIDTEAPSVDVSL